MTTVLLIAVVGYLLGSIPFGYILVRLFRGTDIRATGSGNIGATNVARSAPGLGIATLILDAAKGWFAVWIAARLTLALPPASLAGHSLDQPILMGVAAFCAIAGHMFTIWLSFKGGKGVATGVGAFIALAPKSVLIVLAIFGAIYALTRYVSLGSIVATAAFPILAMFVDGYRSVPLALPFMFGGAVLIIARHHQNIRRLLAGTEHRLEMKQR